MTTRHRFWINESRLQPHKLRELISSVSSSASRWTAGNQRAQANMRHLQHIFFLALAFDYASSLSLKKRDTPAVLSLDIERRHVDNPIERDRLRRRDKTVKQTLDNEVYSPSIVLLRRQNANAHRKRFTFATSPSELRNSR